MQSFAVAVTRREQDSKNIVPQRVALGRAALSGSDHA